jgi:integrase
MAEQKLTDAAIRRVTVEPGKRIELWDTEVRGFGIRRSTQGGTWFCMYRANGRQRRFKLGSFPTLDTEQARKAARKALGRVADDRDPAAERERQRTEAERLTADTVEKIVETFMTRHAKKNRSAKETRRIFDVYILPKWGKRPIGEINRLEVTKRLDAIEEENGPVMADRTLAAVRKLFNWHATRDGAFASPIVKGMARTKPSERARSRTLTDEEIRAIWKHLDGTTFGPCLKFLLLTGQRRDEVAGMVRAEVDGDLWTLPAARNKSKRDHVVPLSPAAKALLDAQPEQGKAGLYFTSNGRTPFQGWTKKKDELDRLSGVTGWTLHDLRRTAKTLMTRAGITQFHADRVLGHVIPGVGGVYDRHDYLKEKRAALETLATAINLILNPHPNVVQLRSEPAA